MVAKSYIAIIIRPNTRATARAARRKSASRFPKNAEQFEVTLSGRTVKLTNLKKLFWPELKITKRDLIQYYADVSPVLLPHLQDRAMVMKRYPNGAAGEFFFMKRAPSPRPEWIELCSIEHGSGNIIDFPIIQDLPALLWVINLGCIDLNQWYARCDDVDRPDYLHFDLDPVPGATWENVLETALVVREALDGLKMPSYPKTTGSKGIHIYVPIVRGPTQKQVWTIAKEIGHVARVRESGIDHGDLQSREASERARAGRLQSERLGPDTGVDLFSAADAESSGLDAGDVERDRKGSSHRRFSSPQRAKEN